MNTKSRNCKDYMDYVRDAQVQRDKYLGDLMLTGLRRMAGFIRSLAHRFGPGHRLTRNWQG
jgi:hypothetical protein